SVCVPGGLKPADDRGQHVCRSAQATSLCSRSRYGDVWFTQIYWFERWQKEAVSRVLRNSGQDESRGIADHNAFELRERFRREDRHRRLQQVQLRFQFCFCEEGWSFNQLMRADTCEKECLPARIANDVVLGRV